MCEDVGCWTHNYLFSFTQSCHWVVFFFIGLPGLHVPLKRCRSCPLYWFYDCGGFIDLTCFTDILHYTQISHDRFLIVDYNVFFVCFFASDCEARGVCLVNTLKINVEIVVKVNLCLEWVFPGDLDLLCIYKILGTAAERLQSFEIVPTQMHYVLLPLSLYF